MIIFVAINMIMAINNKVLPRQGQVTHSTQFMVKRNKILCVTQNEN